MNVTACKTYEEMSELAALNILSEVEDKRSLLLCAATGNSPTGTYQILATKSKSEKNIFKNLRLIKLDEWGGIPENHEVSCERYLQNNILGPLGISSDRYFSFKSDPKNPSSECVRIQSELNREGPIHICVLGLGRNGHIGFNEPGTFLQPHVHSAKLTKDSLAHDMVKSMNPKPAYGMTLGMSDILNSKKIILLIAGDNKEEVTGILMDKKIRTELPASFLWLHDNVECIVDRKI